MDVMHQQIGAALRQLREKCYRTDSISTINTRPCIIVFLIACFAMLINQVCPMTVTG